MKKLFAVAAVAMCAFACSTTQVETSAIVSVSNVSKSFAGEIKALQSEQDTITVNIDRIFEIDDLIENKKNVANDSLSNFVSQLTNKTIAFEQIANSDKIQIKDVTILSAKYNEIEIEATIVALDNSAMVGPFVGLRAVNKTGEIIDLGGGVGCNTKLIADETYVFVGKISNINNIDDSFEKLVFDEDIKQW